MSKQNLYKIHTKISMQIISSLKYIQKNATDFQSGSLRSARFQLSDWWTSTKVMHELMKLGKYFVLIYSPLLRFTKLGVVQLCIFVLICKLCHMKSKGLCIIHILIFAVKFQKKSSYYIRLLLNRSICNILYIIHSSNSLLRSVCVGRGVGGVFFLEDICDISLWLHVFDTK